MSQQFYDPSSKWMLEEQGASILYLAGERNVLSCRARKAEIVQPRKLPDGLLEARLPAKAEPSLYLVEVTTYPEERVVQQVQDDIRLVRQARGVLADALVLCLCPRGTYRVPESVEEKSDRGWTVETLRWKVIEVWKQSATDLLNAPNPALAAWATLAHYDGPPEVLLRRCRDRIDREAGKYHANLLAVTQVFARLHFDKPEWLDILGGKRAMIESPFIQEIVDESQRGAHVKMILHQLQEKFGTVDPDISAGLAQLKEEEQLLRLSVHAMKCKTLQTFAQRLREELPAPAPPSTRGKRRSRKAPD
jgi:predicted transposase YdaD